MIEVRLYRFPLPWYIDPRWWSTPLFGNPDDVGPAVTPFPAPVAQQP